jgi:hypothetical protein
MKINADSGNYSLNHLSNYQQQGADKASNAQAEKSEKKGEEITKEEKNFFAQMYPEKKNEIVDYHYYQKSGQMSGVTLGSLFDKKG